MDASRRAETQQRLREIARMHMMFGGELIAGPAPEQAEAHLRAALAIDPALGPAWGLLGKALFAAEDTDGGLAALKRAWDADPGNLLARGTYGSALLLLGRFREGWEHWASTRALTRRPGPPETEWRGQDLRGRTLLMVCCDGFGDTFQFCRFAPVLASGGARVVVAAQAETLGLLRPLPGVASVVDRAGPLPPHDYWVEDKVLPLLLGIEANNVPLAQGYLKADAGCVAAMRARLPASPGRRIGLVWGGDPRNDQDRARSLPLGEAPALLAPLLGARGAQWCSFQLGPRREELAAMPGCVDLAPYLSDFSDTAAAIACMDLVIGVETAVTHLAAAMGTPTWLLLAHRPDWRWLLKGERSHWYAAMRLFRQPRTDDWAPALAGVAEALT